MPGTPVPRRLSKWHRSFLDGDILLKWTPYSQERLGPVLLFAQNSKVPVISFERTLVFASFLRPEAAVRALGGETAGGIQSARVRAHPQLLLLLACPLPHRSLPTPTSEAIASVSNRRATYGEPVGWCARVVLARGRRCCLVECLAKRSADSHVRPCGQKCQLEIVDPARARECNDRRARVSLARGADESGQVLPLNESPDEQPCEPPHEPPHEQERHDM
jgi:hypothetical protein